MNITRIAVISSIILSSYAAKVEVPERVKWVDKMFYTVNKDALLESPVWINTDAARSAYGSEYMKTLISKAHNVASKYLEYNDYQAYNTFMILSLTFPLHEGLYMSYRETFDQQGLCHEEANNGDVMFKQSKQKIFDQVNSDLEKSIASQSEVEQLKLLEQTDKQSHANYRGNLVDSYTMSLLNEKKDRIANTDEPSNYGHFVKFFKSGEKPFIVNCADVKDDTHIRQYIRGGDGTDLGPVQLSMRWHFDKFIAQKYYLSLGKTLDYGLNYIHQGFKELYYNAAEDKKKLGCVLDGKELNLTKLARATWSGKYNQGQTSKSCRIDDIEELEALEKKVKEGEPKSFFSSWFKTKSSSEEEIAEIENKIKMIKRHPDYHFKNNIEKVKSFINSDSIGFNSSLSFKPSKEVKEAIDQIITNFNDGKANGKKFDKINSIINNE